MAAAVNRSVSPMLVHRENFDESRNVLLEKIERLKKEQKSKSPFLIGSIGEVSRRISHLDHKLQNYTELVAESRASDFPELVPPSTAARRERVERRERDEKELTKFAGIYSIKSTFGVSNSERVKNVSKISRHPNKAVAKKDTGKPKFVELYNYGGYDAGHCTPLPDGVSVTDVLRKVGAAQTHLDRKSSYRSAFEKIFNSSTSQSLLLDAFWWCFLNQFQSDKESQCQLFRRISLNYVQLLLSCNDIHVREAFLKDYPDVLSQAVYAAFCESFPDSYRQFDHAFREMIARTLSAWIVGTKPSPGSSKLWNYAGLEPDNIKQREEMLNKKDKDSSKNKMKTSFLNLDGMTSSSAHSSQTTLNQSASHDSYTSSSKPPDAISKVAQAQGRHRRSAGGAGSPQEGPQSRDEGHLSAPHLPTIRESYSREREGEEEPRAEATEEVTSRSYRRQSSRVSRKPDQNVYWNKAYRKPRESHPAGRGYDFSRNAFNVHGQSPLVAQFLEEKNLTPQAGSDFLVQRTEIDKVPSGEEETYLELVRKGYNNVRQRRKETKALFREGRRASGQFSRTQQAEMRQLQTKEAALLTNPREVKRLCNLIILEQKKDEDSLPAGVEAAVEQALNLAVQTTDNADN